MNLQFERIQALCESLNLPAMVNGYASAAQQAATEQSAYSDFLEGLLKAEVAGRQARKQHMLTRLAGFPAIKTLEEVTELLSALHRKDWGEARDAYGDVLVTLIIGAELAGLDLVDCLALAYDTIKDRRGYLREDGVFVKEPR